MNDAHEMLRIARERYTTKHYNGQKIPREAIEELMEILRLAPSSVNSQPWKFFLISSDESKNPTRLDFVVSGTRTDLLENKVALAVPDGNPAMIESFSDLASRLENGNVFMAMGNSDVPVGQYTSEILTYYGLDEETLANQGLITYGSNVKEVTVQVSENSVDCGVIYQTDAYSAGLSVIDTATQEMCSPVIYPAAVINSGNATEEAKAFLEYLKSSDAMAVFESVGFSPVN